MCDEQQIVFVFQYFCCPLLFCSLFTGAISNSEYLSSNYRVRENIGLERMWKEMVAALLKTLVCICLYGLRKTTRKFSQDSRCCSHAD